MGAVPGLYSHIAQSEDQDSTSIPKPFKSARGHGGKKSKGKVKPQQQPPPPPFPLNRKNSMKVQIISTTMRIIEVIIEAVDLKGANIVVETHIEGLSKGEGDNKIIIEANTKATKDNLIPLMVVVTIITMAIIEVEVAVAIEVAAVVSLYLCFSFL